MEFDRLVYHFRKVGLNPGHIPGVVIDIGANKGQWFLEFRKRYQCAMHLFEADTDNLPYLEETLRESDKIYGSIPTAITIILLGNQKKEDVSFYKTKGSNNTGNSMYLENSCYFLDHNVTKMKMDTLDNLIGDKYDKIRLLKLDVQGAELDILRGAKEKILPLCDLILIEVAFLQYNKGAPLACEVFRAMDEYGFQAIDIIEKHYFGKDMIQADFLFARKGSKYMMDRFGY